MMTASRFDGRAERAPDVGEPALHGATRVAELGARLRDAVARDEQRDERFVLRAERGACGGVRPRSRPGRCARSASISGRARCRDSAGTRTSMCAPRTSASTTAVTSPSSSTSPVTSTVVIQPPRYRRERAQRVGLSGCGTVAAADVDAGVQCVVAVNRVSAVPWRVDQRERGGLQARTRARAPHRVADVRLDRRPLHLQRPGDRGRRLPAAVRSHHLVPARRPSPAPGRSRRRPGAPERGVEPALQPHDAELGARALERAQLEFRHAPRRPASSVRHTAAQRARNDGAATDPRPGFGRAREQHARRAPARRHRARPLRSCAAARFGKPDRVAAIVRSSSGRPRSCRAHKPEERGVHRAGEAVDAEVERRVGHLDRPFRLARRATALRPAPTTRWTAPSVAGARAATRSANSTASRSCPLSINARPSRCAALRSTSP